MPSATESRKLIFMTDHGSTRATASRTRRGPRCLRAAAVLAVRAPAVACVPPAPGDTRCVGAVRVVTAPRDSSVPPLSGAPEVLPVPVVDPGVLIGVVEP